MTIKALTTAIGGLSNPSKMPGLSIGTPAQDCITGGILRNVKGSVCEHCYCYDKGMYSFPVVKEAQRKRMEVISSDLETWADNMAELLALKYRNKAKKDKVFRWHDSGDIQSVDHLTAIASIAETLPDIDFWLPTKEYKMVRAWLKVYEVPSNLTLRVSAPMMGQTIPNLPGTVGSTVGALTGFACTATLDENGNVLPKGHPDKGTCRDCRACWDNSVEYVDYPQH